VTTPQDYATTFELLDTDGDGLLSAAELKALMLVLGEDITDEAAIEAVRVMDQDGDDLVSLEELAGYLSSRAAPQP
jgi:Ca2+-binding EF-hand superfamily protein